MADHLVWGEYMQELQICTAGNPHKQIQSWEKHKYENVDEKTNKLADTYKLPQPKNDAENTQKKNK